MNLVAIETADPGILAVAHDGTHTDPSPGFALLDGDAPAVGRAAASRARLLPRRIHDRFWEQLDDSSLARPHPAHLSTADLVHLHLREIRADLPSSIDGAVVAVPGHVDRRWLGFLLGIMEASELPVRGVVDAAVAAVSHEGLCGGTALHLDILLHRTVMTSLSVNSEVVRRRVRSEEGLGLVEFRRAWVRYIAAQFVRSTRFDPLKLATTEQELYDRLPAVLGRLASVPATEVRMSAGGRSYHVEVTRKGLAESVSALSRRITGLASGIGAEAPHRLVLSERSGTIPGLANAVASATSPDVTILDRAAAARGALRYSEQLMSKSGEVVFTTRLRVGGSSANTAVPTVGPPPTHRNAGRSATHVLYRGHAYPVTDEPLVIGTAPAEGGRSVVVTGQTAGISRSHCTVRLVNGHSLVEDHSSYGSLLNGLPVRGESTLVVGDRLLLGSPGEELVAIIMED